MPNSIFYEIINTFDLSRTLLQASYENLLYLKDLNGVTLNIAGLCSETAMDTFYTMVNGDVGLKRFFSGNFGWKIYWEKSLNV